VMASDEAIEREAEALLRLTEEGYFFYRTRTLSANAVCTESNARLGVLKRPCMLETLDLVP
jgi:hypothetical protein